MGTYYVNKGHGVLESFWTRLK